MNKSILFKIFLVVVKFIKILRLSFFTDVYKSAYKFNATVDVVKISTNTQCLKSKS